jgi:hypothetical protein
MVSVITDRVAAVVGGSPVSQGGYGIIQCTNVGGTPNLVTADTEPSINGYVVNQVFSIRPVVLNDGPVDVNFGNGGFVSLLKPNGDELGDDEFNPALEYLVKFNGNEMRILAPSF